MIQNPKLAVALTPDETLCIGCMKATPKAFTVTGRIYVTVNYIAKRDVTELVFNPVTNDVDYVLVERKPHPISEWRKGTLCSDCASDYSVVTHTRKDGSTWWEPRVVVDPSATLHTTLKGTDERVTDKPAREHVGYVYDPKSKRSHFEHASKDEIDVACYSKFARGR